MSLLANATLVLMLSTAGAAMATDFSREAITGATPYKDLPGVREPQKGAAGNSDGFDCRSEIDTRLYPRRYYRGDPFDRYADNGIIYSCSRNGVVVESRDAPRRGWIPGQPQYGWPWGE